MKPCKVTSSEFRYLYEKAADDWRGCAWPTEHGQTGLNLSGITSAHARLLAGATCGKEKKSWEDALVWLERVEADARLAKQQARRATELAETGDYRNALRHVDNAVALEARYRQPLVWLALRDAILAAKQSCD